MGHPNAWLPGTLSLLGLHSTKSDTDETPDDPDQLLMVAVHMRQTFSESIRIRVQTSKDVDEDDGRSLWASLDKNLVERGVGPFVRYSILFRSLYWDRNEKTLNEFVAEQYILQSKIKATGVTLTPELDRVISLYVALPDDRFEHLKSTWFHNFDNKPFSHNDMVRTVERLLELDETRKKEREKEASENMRRNGGRRRRSRSGRA